MVEAVPSPRELVSSCREAKLRGVLKRAEYGARTRKASWDSRADEKDRARMAYWPNLCRLEIYRYCLIRSE
jgi:hypothetical protein